MSWTKRELIDEAFREIGLASYVFDLDPEERQTALRRLDTMMATWEVRGIRVGYNFPATPKASDLDDDSGLPDRASETVYLNLAVRIAPGFGRPVLPDTKTSARTGYDALLFAAAQPREQQLPDRLPRGAGNKPTRINRPFFPQPDTSPMQVTAGGDLDIVQG